MNICDRKKFIMAARGIIIDRRGKSCITSEPELIFVEKAENGESVLLTVNGEPYSRVVNMREILLNEDEIASIKKLLEV